MTYAHTRVIGTDLCGAEQAGLFHEGDTVIPPLFE